MFPGGAVLAGAGIRRSLFPQSGHPQADICIKIYSGKMPVSFWLKIESVFFVLNIVLKSVTGEKEVEWLSL
jgi:hypothetical protein